MMLARFLNLIAASGGISKTWKSLRVSVRYCYRWCPLSYKNRLFVSGNNSTFLSSLLLPKSLSSIRIILRRTDPEISELRIILKIIFSFVDGPGLLLASYYRFFPFYSTLSNCMFLNAKCKINCFTSPFSSLITSTWKSPIFAENP